MSRVPVPLLTLALIGAQACAIGATAQRPDAAARALLDSAVALHGGHAALGALGTVTFRLAGERVMIDQSRRADPPWDREPSEVWIIRDAAGRWFWQSVSSYPGLGRFGSRRVTGPGHPFEIDVIGTGHGPEVMPLQADDTSRIRRDLSRFIPGLLLELARERPASLMLERRRAGGTPVNVLTFHDHRDRPLQLLLQPGTHQLLGYVHRRADPVYGVAVDSVAYHGYRAVGGLRLPGHLEEYQNGQLARELDYVVTVGAVPESLFAIPAGYVAPGTLAHHMGAEGEDPLEAIGAGVYVDRQSGAMVVEFRDHAAVFDCPNDFATSQATLDAVRTRLRGKPVRYLIASHTHPDHCGGARPYFLAGATVLAASDHAGFYRRLAEARHSIAPDGYSANPRQPVIEAIPPGGERVLSDGTQRVVLFNVGPSPHSEETIIALVGGELLWQVDLFLAPMTGPVSADRPVTAWLVKELDRRGLRFERIIDTHLGRVFTRAEFDQAVSRGREQPAAP